MMDFKNRSSDETVINHFLDIFTLSESSKEILRRLFAFLANKTRSNNLVPYGLLVQINQEEDSLDFLTQLNACLRQLPRVKNYELLHAKESQLSLNAIKHNYSSRHILAITDFEESGSIDSLCRLFRETPDIVKIVFASETVIHSRFLGNSEFYYRLLPRHISLSPLGAKEIYARFMAGFEYDFRTSEDFRQELLYYIDTIYETADLKGQAFIDDLRRRILLQMDEQEGQEEYRKGLIVDKEFVPYSDRVRDRKAAESALLELTEEELSVSSSQPHLESQDAGTISPAVGVTDDSENNPGCPINVVITNVSDVKVRENKLQSQEYIDEDGNLFSGVMTNEAPIKSIMQRMESRREHLDRVIYIESELVRKPVDIPEYGQSASSDYLRFLIGSFADEKSFKVPQYDKEKDSVHIQDEPDETSVSEAVFAVYERIWELYEECQRTEPKKQLNIFIESNGGVRYVLTMLLSITKTLENSLENICIKEITSMVIHQHPVRIFDTRAIYETTQITSTIEEYMNYGRISSMKKYVLALFSKSDDTPQKTSVLSIVAKLEKLAEDIQLCRTTMMLEDFYSSGGIGSEISQFLLNYGDSTDSACRIFNYIISRIYSEYQEYIYCGFRSDVNLILYLPKVIKWCLSKDYVQQALTLCAERVPEYLFASGKIKLQAELQNELNNTDTGHYETCYYFIAHLNDTFRQLLNAPKYNVVLQLIHDKDTAGSLGLSEANWSSMRRSTPLPSVSATSEYQNIADRIYNLANYYIHLTNSLLVAPGNLERIFSHNSFDSAYLDKTINISNKKSTAVRNMLQGFYVDDNNARCYDHKNIDTKQKRLMLLIPFLVDDCINETPDLSVYEQMIRELYEGDDELIAALTCKYSDKQVEKYNIHDFVQLNQLITNISEDNLQHILYLYSLCKEQRNLSNHAHVADEDLAVAMKSDQIKTVISALIRMCE